MSERSQSGIFRRAFVALLLTVLWGGAAVLGILVFEWSLPKRPPNSDRYFSDLRLHPYSGFHNVGSSASARPVPAELQLITGDRPGREGDRTVKVLGFADSVDFLNPPAKPANELRVIVIGGSGAQG